MTVIALDTVRRDCPEYVDELREQTPDSLCSLLERSDAVTERVRARKASWPPGVVGPILTPAPNTIGTNDQGAPYAVPLLDSGF